MFVRFHPVSVFRRFLTGMCTVPSSAENINTQQQGRKSESECMFKHAAQRNDLTCIHCTHRYEYMESYFVLNTIRHVQMKHTFQVSS